MMARWYAVDNMGIATLCVNEADAQKTAREATEQFPRRAPYIAAQLVVLPVGWRIVPIVPTDAMQDEGAGAARDEHGRHDCASIGWVHAEAVYCAMIAATPEPPK